MPRRIGRRVSRRTVLRTGAAALCFPSLVAGFEAPREVLLKISVDTPSNHLRNESLDIFVTRLAAVSHSSIRGVVFSSAQLARDRDVVKALYWGLVDIGIPAISKMTRFDANANIFTLPMFYGCDLATINMINDGPIGDRLFGQMAEKTKTRVLGRSLDLGFTNLYTTERRVVSPRDMRGLKVRVPGSRASLELYKLFGANPVVVPFSDLAISVSQGNVDAVQTTHETLRSARLWESGIRYCFEERSSYIGYVPLISRHTWQELTESQQAYISTTWEQIVDESRKFARQQQIDARNELERNGVEMITNSEFDVATRRDELIDRSFALGEALHMDMELVAAAANMLNAKASHDNV